jgi:hypothetical protein
VAVAGYAFHLGNWLVLVFAALFALSLLFPLFMYFARPAAAAKDARTNLVRHIRVATDGISIKVQNKEVMFPWKRFKFAWDLGSYVALVLSPYAAITLPKASMPAGAQQLIEQSIGTAA